ncbi:leucine-rich repeat-containing protein 74B isoform X2 [Ascaphus truei]|uniref:leucine-rich repeat-containing protein 74B isoform X2 n=1 Tax=Ascaphus truei TaxID=8439 RepID=UPI003F5A5D3C
MVLSKRFSKDVGSMLPSVEEVKDAELEEEAVGHISYGGISSRPTSRPLPNLSRGSVDNKTVPRSNRTRSGKRADGDLKAAMVPDSKEEPEHEASDKDCEENLVETKREEDWDTELEMEDVKDSYDPTGKASYLSACQLYGVVPISYFLRHMRDADLIMRHHGLGSQAVKALAISLETNTSIVNLNLSDNWLEGDGAAAIAETLKENCYISEIHLSDNKLGLKGARVLSLMLVENTALRKLNLSGNEFNDQAAQYFSDALTNNQKVESMDLSRNMFGDGSGEILGGCIAENTGMTELNLSWNYFRGKAAVAIAKGLGANIFLRVLDLSYNGFGNDGAAALGEALKVNNVLEVLNISNNRISLEGVIRFALCLKENKTLRVLRISRNPMQSEGCFGILKAIQANSESAIESLDFSDIIVNKAFDDLYSTVKAVMPNLSIKHGGNSDMFKRHSPKTDPINKVKQHIKENNLQLVELFDKVGENKSPLMTHKEFRQDLMSTGIIMPQDELQQLIDFLDKDQSGTIDISAFQRALSS